MRVLVTGSEGFVGRRLVRILHSSGYQVVTLNRTDGDISQVSFPTSQIDHVFHLAALTSVPDSWKNPLNYYKTNVIGTANVLENCVRHQCSCTFISTYVYGKPKYIPIDELHETNPSSPYAQSKLLCEEMCRFYHKTHGVPIIILRPFNIFGFGQDENFLIPTILSQLLDDSRHCITLQDLSPSRDYVYIDDFIDALLRTLFVEEHFSVINISTGVSLTVKEVVDIIKSVFNSSKPIDCSNQVRKNEASIIVGHNAYANRILKWQPRHSFKEGIQAMHQEWNKKNA